MINNVIYAIIPKNAKYALTYQESKVICLLMSKEETEKTGTWIVKQVPQALMRRVRMAALAQNKTVRQLLMELVQEHLTELERKGLVPKGK
jgi:hypothetical protein